MPVGAINTQSHSFYPSASYSSFNHRNLIASESPPSAPRGTANTHAPRLRFVTSLEFHRPQKRHRKRGASGRCPSTPAAAVSWLFSERTLALPPLSKRAESFLLQEKLIFFFTMVTSTSHDIPQDPENRNPLGNQLLPRPDELHVSVARTRIR